MKAYQARHKETQDYTYPLALKLIQAVSRAPEIGVATGEGRGIYILDYEGVSLKYEYEMQYLGFGRVRFIDIRALPDRWTRD